MDQKELEKSKLYMESYHPKYYNNFIKSISKFDEDLKLSLENYYLKMVRDEYKYDNDYVRNFTDRLCKSFNELNHPEINYYVEYCLQFHEKDFLCIMIAIQDICMKTNIVLVEMCKRFAKYGVRKDREELLKNIFKYVEYLNEDQNEEILKILDYVMEIEKKHILECYEKAKNGETFCDMCTPYCLVEDEKTKTKKRTTPTRL